MKLKSVSINVTESVDCGPDLVLSTSQLSCSAAVILCGAAALVPLCNQWFTLTSYASLTIETGKLACRCDQVQRGLLTLEGSN